MLALLALLWLAGAALGATMRTTALDARAQTMHALDGIGQFWIDTSGQLGIDEVASRGDSLPWQLMVANTRYPIDGQALWLRFRAHQALAGQRWFVEVTDSGLDRGVLYRRLETGGWDVQEAGDVRAVPDWPMPGRLPTFMMAGRTDTPLDYYLRLEHARVPYSAPVRLVSGSSLAISRDLEQFLLGGYFGLVALVLLMAVGLTLVWRDRLLAVYSLYVAAVGAAQLAQVGTGAQYVWPQALAWNRLSTFVLPSLSAAAALWFLRELTEPARHARRLDRTVLAVIAVHVLLVLLDAFHPLGHTYQLIGYLILVMMALAVVLLVQAWHYSDDPYVRLAVLGFIPLVVMSLFPLARTLDLMSTNVLTRYGMTIGAALEMPTLLYAISLRAAARREARVRAKASATTDALTGLAHQRVLQLRLEAALQRARRQGSRFALIGVHVVNWQKIARRRGQQAGEKVLVLTASRLRRLVRDGDLAARVGEADFALLLDGQTTRAQALELARLSQSLGERGSALLSQGDELQLQVSVVMLPQRSMDAGAVLDRVMDAARAPDGVNPRGELRAGPVRVLG